MKVGLTQSGLALFRLTAPRTDEHRRRAGFTVVETMIVLAVTGALFLVAMVAVSGRQNETEFQQAINDIQDTLQSTIASVTSGDYSSQGNFSCSDPNPSAPGDKPLLSSTPAQEGVSSGCILLGKAVQFAPKLTPADSQAYFTYLVAGLRNNNGSMTTAYPMVVAPTTSQSNIPDASVKADLEYGLSVVSMKYVSSSAGTVPIGAVAFVNGLGTYSAQGYASGSQQFYLVPIQGTSLNQTPPAAAEAIDTQSIFGAGLANSFNAVTSSSASYSVQICFASATTNQSGKITIGGAGSNNLDTVTTTIYNTKDCT